MSYDPSPRRAGRRPSVAAQRRAAHPMSRRWLVVSVLAMALAWFCSQSLAQTAVAPASPSAAAVVDAAARVDYRISRGDELNLRFYFTPELNTAATVRSDGRISLPLLGELSVEGLTVAELTALVEKLLSPQVKRAQVAINVQSAATQRVFVGGEVAKPGMQALAGPLTALQAVMVAEGMKDTAAPDQVLVLRRTASGGRQILRSDLHAVMMGAKPDDDIVLQPFDVVVVPRSGIADVGRWVDLYIRRVLPISFGFSYTIDNRKGATP